MIGTTEAVDVFAFSVRDGFVQVSAFVAATVLLFSYAQYRTGGRLVERLEENERYQPIVGGLLGLTPGCGGAIVAMPLYVRGSISFGTVIATLAATAGDSAFVILALSPKAGVYAYGIALVAGVSFGYAVDYWGLGTARVDRAVARLGAPMTDGGFATSSVASDSPSVPARETSCETDEPDAGGSASAVSDAGWASRVRSPLARLTHGVHVLWWGIAALALGAGVEYLRRGAPEVAFELAPTFDGLFTVTGVLGTTLSVYLYVVGRRVVGDGDVGRLRDSFAGAYETFQHAAMETSMVTVWVIAAYLLYEYSIAILALDVHALAAAAGVLAPLAGAGLGLVPGCAPQIVFAGVYAEGGIPFSALAANAVSQDGDALFPLMAIDMKAAVVATIYTTIPAVAVGVLLHYFWPYAQFGFGVVG